MQTSNAATDQTCGYCGMTHKSICPRIKRIEFSEMSPSLWKVVEFFAPNEYPKMEVGSTESK